MGPISVAVLAAAFAAGPNVVPLWPGGAPGSEDLKYQEQEIVGGRSPEDHARRIYNVSQPTLTIYLPEPARATGTGVVICPGGGFRLLSIDFEGTDVARYLNSIGVAAFVLKYRLMETQDAGENDPAIMAERRKIIIPLAVADGQQAVRLVREHAAEWSVAPDRIGILGFSAGGYVTAAVAVRHDAASRPSFAAPIYGAMPDDVTPPADAPPLFLAHANDDPTVPVLDTTVRMYTAWKKAGLSAEMHIYAAGGHGFGMLKNGRPSDTWYERFSAWLGAQGLLSRK